MAPLPTSPGGGWTPRRDGRALSRAAEERERYRKIRKGRRRSGARWIAAAAVLLGAASGHVLSVAGLAEILGRREACERNVVAEGGAGYLC